MIKRFHNLSVWWIISITLPFAVSPGNIFAQETLTLGGIEVSFNHEIGAAILYHAYERLQIRIKVNQYPARRSLLESNSGRIDGEVQRIDDIQVEFPNLIKVPVPLFDLTGAAYAHKPDIVVEGWHSLRQYRIGIRRGLKWAEKGTDGMNPIVVDVLPKLFELVQTDRIDVFLYNPSIADFYLDKLEKHTIRKLSPLMVRQPLYHYLHQKHLNLVPKITKVLQDMANQGTSLLIHDRVIAEILQK